MTERPGAPVPPLPDTAELLTRSEWARAQPGLVEAAEWWLHAAPDVRARLARRAARLAIPRANWRSVAAVASTGGRVLSAVGPTALADVFVSASRARRAREDGAPRPRPRDEERPKRSPVETAQELVRAGGPTYVKLGQFIASAKGLLPEEWVDAFAWCRDEVPPLRPGVAESIVERAFRRPLTESFSSFSTEPIAAASIAQVHRATLRDGSDVVVKVRRPGLLTRFESDIRVMAISAAIAERTLPEARIANLRGFVELFAQIVLEELDLRLEAVNMVELALTSEAAGHDYVRYARPVPELVDPRVLVMERLPGVRYTDALAAYPDKVDGARLLRLGSQGVLEQTLIYGVFHGDLHAGNVLIDPDGNFALVDFGVVGRLTADQRAALIRFMIAFASGNVRGQLEAMREFGAVPPGIDLDPLVAQLEKHAEVAYAMDLRPGADPAALNQLTEELGAIIRLLSQSGFVVPRQLVLFFKNLLYLNGFAATLAPDINLLDEIEPIFAYFSAKYAAEMSAATTRTSDTGTEDDTGR